MKLCTITQIATIRRAKKFKMADGRHIEQNNLQLDDFKSHTKMTKRIHISGKRQSR